jgi:DNA-binding MarR family transcriptional regulator
MPKTKRESARKPLQASLITLSTLAMPAVARLDRVGFEWLEKRLAKHDLSLPEFRLVGVLLGEEEGLSQRELARRLGVKPPTVSLMLPRLEKAGVVERKVDPTDSRAYLVCLRQGGADLGAIMELVSELDAIAFRGLTAREKETLRTLLDAAAKRVTAHAGA